MFYSRINALCAGRGVKITNVITEMGMGSGNLSKWKAGGVPKGDTLSKLADYFHVSTDYLLGRTDDPSPVGEGKTLPTVADEERLDQELIERLCQLTPEEVEKVDAFVQGLLAAR